ncbi:MAG: hypothetical protein R3F59_12475 [Myxococcota bacterium]
MNGFDLLTFGILGVVVTIALLGWWLAPERVARRKLRAMAPSPVSALRPGQRAMVRGEVVLGDTLQSPFSGEPCAYWHVRIREKRGKNWHTRAERHEGLGFFVDDGTGRVWIDARGYRLPLELQEVGGTGSFDEATPREQEVLSGFGIDGTTMLGFNRLMEFFEGSLVAGEVVCAAGDVTVAEVDGEPVLALVPGKEGLLVSDTV